MNLIEIREALAFGRKESNGRSEIFSEGRDPIKWEEVRTSDLYQDLLKEALERAEVYMAEPIRTLPFSLYKIFDETGSRIEYENVFFDRRARLNTFALLALVYGEKKYLDSLEDILWAICDEYIWAVPAHLYGKSTSVPDRTDNCGVQDGILRGEPRAPWEVIDLFSAETAFALTEITSLLEDQLSPLVVYRARKEIFRRIFKPLRHSLYIWDKITSNWAAVCAGSAGAAALYIIEDDELLAPLLHRLLGNMEAFLSGYEEDGACTEGIGYWRYGFGFFVYFSELLRQRTAGKIDLFTAEKVKNIATFQQKCYLSEDQVISFADSFPTFRFQIGLTHFLKGRYDEVEVPNEKYKAGLYFDRCQHWPQLVRNFVWRKNYEESLSKEDRHYLPNAQIFVSKLLKDGNVICFAAKGGHNGEPHNHNDVGNFIFHINGESLLTDTGCGEYTREYFGPGRYDIFCNSSRGHSVPVIGGIYQTEGHIAAAKVLRVTSSESRDEFVIDLTQAYNVSNLASCLRCFIFEKGDIPRLLLKDCLTFKHTASSLTERFITFNRPELIHEGTVKVAGEKGSIEISYDSRALSCVFEQTIFVDHAAVSRDIYIIDLNLKKPAMCAEVEISIDIGR